MLNAIWVGLIVLAVFCGALGNSMNAVSTASIDAAKGAVELAIGLVGVMAFWIGLMRVLEHAGMLNLIARMLRPIMKRLFPEVPETHPAMSMMILNMAANMLGLANAATPFGIKAIMELNKLNAKPGTATNAMALFLAINTSSLALLPTGVIAMRASLGSTQPASIIITTLIATACSTIIAILSAKLLCRSPFFAANAGTLVTDTEQTEKESIDNHLEEKQGGTPMEQRIALGLGLLLLVALIYAGTQRYQEAAQAISIFTLLRELLSQWLLPLLIVGIVLIGLYRGVKIYDAVVEGGKEGFEVALRIIPFLVAILVAIGMLRASGAIDLMVENLRPLTAMIGMPAETLPMAILRPLSGSGAYGVAAEIMQTYGADSLIGNIVSTMQGSTETTFYVLAVYFGAAQVKHVRHTLAACLIADLTGVLAAVWACRLFFAA
ncbi:MAG: nucleoside recognition domain-containing protein [Myxococcota bacterium]|jgi:spore maturation protein SpmA|nr:nucleoside recognition domain-containing protein [Myxococcota bacterium]